LLACVRALARLTRHANIRSLRLVKLFSLRIFANSVRLRRVKVAVIHVVVKDVRARVSCISIEWRLRRRVKSDCD